MMKKICLSLAVLGVMVLPASGVLASATLTTIQFENSFTNITVDAGSVVDTTVRFNLTSPTAVDSIQYEFVGSGEAPGYWNIEPDAINPGLNQYAQFPMNTPKHSGTWPLKISLCGAALPGSDQNCHLTPVATHTYPGVVTTNPVVSVPVGTPVPTTTPVPGGSNPFPSINWTVACHNPVVAQLFPAQCGVVVLPGTGGGAGDIHIDSTLSYGMMHSAQVSELQSFLIAKGLLHISTPTGNFLNLTLAAVMQYQVQHNISPTGVVGPLTRAAINADAAGMQD